MLNKLLICFSVCALIGCTSSTTVTNVTTTTTTTAVPTISPSTTPADALADAMGERFVQKFCGDMQNIGTVMSKALFEAKWDRTDVTWQAAFREFQSRC